MFTLKRKAGVFKFLTFEECFRNKAPFSCRISVNRRSNRANKAAFSDSLRSLSVVETGHKKRL